MINNIERQKLQGGKVVKEIFKKTIITICYFIYFICILIILAVLII
jgi:hypothetical protein